MFTDSQQPSVENTVNKYRELQAVSTDHTLDSLVDNCATIIEVLQPENNPFYFEKLEYNKFDQFAEKGEQQVPSYYRSFMQINDWHGNRLPNKTKSQISFELSEKTVAQLKDLGILTTSNKGKQFADLTPESKAQLGKILVENEINESALLTNPEADSGSPAGPSEQKKLAAEIVRGLKNTDWFSVRERLVKARANTLNEVNTALKRLNSEVDEAENIKKNARETPYDNDDNLEQLMKVKSDLEGNLLVSDPNVPRTVDGRTLYDSEHMTDDFYFSLLTVNDKIQSLLGETSESETVDFGKLPIAPGSTVVATIRRKEDSRYREYEITIEDVPANIYHVSKKSGEFTPKRVKTGSINKPLIITSSYTNTSILRKPYGAQEPESGKKYKLHIYPRIERNVDWDPSEWNMEIESQVEDSASET